MGNTRKLYGLTALFTKPDDIINAAEKVAADVITSYSIHYTKLYELYILLIIFSGFIVYQLLKRFV